MAAAADLFDEAREYLPGFLTCRAGENPLPSFSYFMQFQIEQEFSMNKFISIIFSFFFLLFSPARFLIFHLFSLYTLQIQFINRISLYHKTFRLLSLSLLPIHTAQSSFQKPDYTIQYVKTQDSVIF